jgi:hypothetical protein
MDFHELDEPRETPLTKGTTLLEGLGSHSSSGEIEVAISDCFSKWGTEDWALEPYKMVRYE